MTVKELASKLSLTFLSGEELSSRREIDGCYCGDLLSWVMGRAQSGDAWITIMSNANIVAVGKRHNIKLIQLPHSRNAVGRHIVIPAGR